MTPKEQLDDETIGFFVGIFNAILYSIPLWALIYFLIR